MTRAVLSAIAACLILAGCSGGSQPIQPAPGDQPPADAGFAATLLRDASGAPSGIRVSWDAVPDVAGYNLYRMSTPIPDSERGKPEFRVNSEPIPPLPVEGTVTFDDMFPVNVGEEWHYRVSSVDDSGDESDLSPESSLTITDFIVTELLTLTGGIGDTVEIEGERFGSFDTATDKVFFPGVELDAGGALVPAMIEATVTDWESTNIRVNVPQGATTGEVRVQSNGLSQDTPEVFTNSDPYIETINPASGNTDDVVTVTGGNFGAAQDASHQLLLEGRALPAVQYVSYSDTQISFNPLATGGASSFANLLPVLVRVNGRSSNVGEFDLLNRRPLAALSATPLDGSTPQTVELDASASADPDNGDSVLYSWDFDGDGATDFDSGNDPTVTHTYEMSGDFRPTVYVIDLSSANSSAGVDIHVALSPLVIADNGTFAPGAEFFQDDETVPISYSLTGGEPPYSIDWYLEDASRRSEVLLITDTDVPYGNNVRRFPIDTSSTQPAPGSGEIPAGLWRLRAEAQDGGAGNDPDPVESWPKYANGQSGTFRVYRYDVFVMQDAEGDPQGMESQGLTSALQQLGYKVDGGPSSEVQLADIVNSHSVVWSADGPYSGNDGSEPFGWLDQKDLDLAKQYMDAGGALVIFGPPAGNGQAFPQDDAFNQQYSPFQSIAQGKGPIDLSVDPAGGTLIGGPYPVQSFSSGQALGLASSFAGTGEASFMDANGVLQFAAAHRATSPSIYMAMFCMSSIDPTTIQPAGTTRQQILDNIVAGLIGKSLD